MKYQVSFKTPGRAGRLHVSVHLKDSLNALFTRFPSGIENQVWSVKIR